MASAVLGNPQLFQDDQIIPVRCGNTTIITKGDWMQFSGGYVVGCGTEATPIYKVSGAGIALDNNPKYDELGRAYGNSAMAVLTHGVVRVSATAASLSGLPGLGTPMAPLSTASGIVGATGATGVGAVWGHVGVIAASASNFVMVSGVGKLINIITAGDYTAAQVDVLFDARMLGVNPY